MKTSSLQYTEAVVSGSADEEIRWAVGILSYNSWMIINELSGVEEIGKGEGQWACSKS